MKHIRDFVEKLTRETYRQGWDDCVRHFGLKYVVADLKHMDREQDRQVKTVFHKIRSEFDQ